MIPLFPQDLFFLGTCLLLRGFTLPNKTLHHQGEGEGDLFNFVYDRLLAPQDFSKDVIPPSTLVDDHKVRPSSKVD